MTATKPHKIVSPPLPALPPELAKFIADLQALEDREARAVAEARAAAEVIRLALAESAATIARCFDASEPIAGSAAALPAARAVQEVAYMHVRPLVIGLHIATRGRPAAEYALRLAAQPAAAAYKEAVASALLLRYLTAGQTHAEGVELLKSEAAPEWVEAQRLVREAHLLDRGASAHLNHARDLDRDLALQEMEADEWAILRNAEGAEKVLALFGLRGTVATPPRVTLKTKLLAAGSTANRVAITNAHMASLLRPPAPAAAVEVGATE